MAKCELAVTKKFNSDHRQTMRFSHGIFDHSSAFKKQQPRNYQISSTLKGLTYIGGIINFGFTKTKTLKLGVCSQKMERTWSQTRKIGLQTFDQTTNDVVGVSKIWSVRNIQKTLKLDVFPEKLSYLAGNRACGSTFLYPFVGVPVFLCWS